MIMIAIKVVVLTVVTRNMLTKRPISLVARSSICPRRFSTTNNILYYYDNDAEGGYCGIYRADNKIIIWKNSTENACGVKLTS